MSKLTAAIVGPGNIGTDLRNATASPPTRSSQRVGEAGYVGGQEDMIIDVALELVAEREGASAPRAVR